MATATARRPPARAASRGRRPRTSRSSPHPPWWLVLPWRAGVWFGRCVWRMTRWSAPRISRASVAYGKATTRRYRERAKLVAEHGNVPMVRDASTGWWMPAAAVKLAAPEGGDAEVRQAHQAALARQRIRDDGARAYRQNGGLVVELTFVERITMWWRGEDPAEFVQRSAMARMAVAARSATRMGRAVEAHWPEAPKPDPFGGIELPEQRTRRNTPGDPRPEQPAPEPIAEPDPVDLDAVAAGSTTGTTEGGTTMANDVRTFSDLEHPDVDPFEYPEQLPGHLQQVGQLMHENADELDEEMQALKQKSTSVDRYVEYMTSAQVVPNVVQQIEEAAEGYRTAMERLASARDAVGTAGEAMQRAQQAAAVVYGENEVPRFDQAS